MSLERADLDPDPLRQFERWHEQAGGDAAVALAHGDRGRSARRCAWCSCKAPTSAASCSTRATRGGRRRELAEIPARAILFYGKSPDARCASKARSSTRRPCRVGGVLPDSPAGRPDRRLDFPPERADRSRKELDRALRRAGGPLRGQGGAATAALGRLSARSGELRVLGAPRQPDARSLPLPARRRRLGGRAAEPLTDLATVCC